MKHFCTYLDWNYLDRGLALHESMEAHCQPYHLHVLTLCDRAADFLSRAALLNVTVTPLSDFVTGDLERAQSNRSRHEWIWTLTPHWMLWLFEHKSMPHLSYIDADCFFFGNHSTLFGELFDVDIAITPHRYSPDRRWMATNNGLYNVGLVFIRRNWAGLTCLQEWARLCLERCTQSEGADQRYWDNLLPAYKGHAIQHKGVDLAPWNQLQYTYSLRKEKAYVDEDPLVFYHFHKRLEPGFELDPFVREHIYPPYAMALQRARAKC
jgi:hypothetical protein